MKKVNWGKYVWQLLIAIVPVPITIWLTVMFIQDQEEVKHLEYARIVRESFINLPSILPQKVQLTYDGNPVGNLSSVKFQLFNRTGKSFQDVKLFFEFPSPTTNPPQLLSKDIKVPENYPQDGFHEVNTSSSSIGWKVDTINTSQSLFDTFEFTFLFLGSRAPDIEIALLKTGLDLVPLSPSRSSKTENVIVYIGIVLGGLVYITLLLLMLRFARSQRSRFTDSLQVSLSQYFQKIERRLQTSDPEALATDVTKVYKDLRAKRKDPIYELVISAFRWVKGERAKSAQPTDPSDNQ